MTKQDLFNLNFWEASKVFQNIVGPGKIDTYPDVDKYKKKVDSEISGLTWGTLSKDPSSSNAKIMIIEKWYTTKVRVIFDFKYDDNIAIRYYIGNTPTGCTLKEIAFVGIDSYWSETFPDIEKLGLDKEVSIQIPEIKYMNGRKGTVSDMLSKKYNMLKIRLDVAACEISRFLSDGSFIEAWGRIGDNYSDADPEACNALSGQLGNILASLVSDSTTLSIDDLALFVKTEARNFTDFNESNTILRYLGNRERFSDSGLTKPILDALKSLRWKINRKTELDKLTNDLQSLVADGINRSFDQFLVLNPEIGLTKSELQDIVQVDIDKCLRYRHLHQ